MRKFTIFPAILAVALSGTLVSSALAGGIKLYETGTPEVGLAAAGWAARAQDAGTVLTNPAGMTRLAGDQLLVGAQLLYGKSDFSPDSATTNSGGGGDNPVGWFPGASFYYSHSLSERLKMGAALYGDFGLSLDYGDTWAGRYCMQKGTLFGLTFAPTMAYRLTDKLSVGAGLNVMYGYFSQTVAVNNLKPGVADGSLELEDSEVGYGGNFGLLYEFDRETRLGVQYTTEINLDFADATPKFSGLGPLMSAALNAAGLLNSNVNLSMTVPQSVMTSFYHQLNRTWAVMGNLGWQDWSEYGKVGIRVESATPTSLTVNQNYDDTYHVSLGAQYDTGGDWLISMGGAFDSGMVDDATRTPATPLGDSYRLSVGGQYKLRPGMTLGLAYTFLWEGDLDMRLTGRPFTGDVTGSYDNTHLHFFAVNLQRTF